MSKVERSWYDEHTIQCPWCEEWQRETDERFCEECGNPLADSCQCGEFLGTNYPWWVCRKCLDYQIEKEEIEIALMQEEEEMTQQEQDLHTIEEVLNDIRE